MQKKRLKIILLTTLLILCIPLIAMQFTNEVNWNIGDFVVAGFLFFSTGLIFDIVIRKVNKIESRIVLLIAILVLFLLIWAELAVGIFGTPFSGN